MHSVFNTWLKVSASLSYLTVCGLVYFLVSTFSRHPVPYLYLTTYARTNLFLRHLIVNTTTTKVSLWFVARLKINFVFYLKFPFTSSDLGSEYRSRIFNTLCIILKLFPLRPLKVRDVVQGSEISCEIWIHTRLQNLIFQGSEKLPLTYLLLLYFCINCLKNRWLAEKQIDKPLHSFEWSAYAETPSNSLQLPMYAFYCHFFFFLQILSIHWMRWVENVAVMANKTNQLLW